MIDEYLDRLFNRLAGTGRAGRRALAEAEDHLRSAFDDGLDQGMSHDEAEREAVRRFGDADQIARRIQLANGGVASVLSGLWLLVGLVVIVVGAGRLLKAGDLAVLMMKYPETRPACASHVSVGWDCSTTPPAMVHLIWTGLAVIALGSAVLLGRRLVMRVNGFAGADPWFPFYTFWLLSIAAILLTFAPPMLGVVEVWSLGGPEGLPGWHTSIITGAAALLAAIGVVVAGLIHRRRAVS